MIFWATLLSFLSSDFVSEPPCYHCVLFVPDFILKSDCIHCLAPLPRLDFDFWLPWLVWVACFSIISVLLLLNCFKLLAADGACSFSCSWNLSCLCTDDALFLSPGVYNMPISCYLGIGLRTEDSWLEDFV